MSALLSEVLVVGRQGVIMIFATVHAAGRGGDLGENVAVDGRLWVDGSVAAPRERAMPTGKHMVAVTFEAEYCFANGADTKDRFGLLNFVN